MHGFIGKDTASLHVLYVYVYQITVYYFSKVCLFIRNSHLKYSGIVEIHLERYLRGSVAPVLLF